MELNKSSKLPKKEVEKGWAIVQALLFCLAIGSGIARYMGVDNIYTFVAVMIGYMGVDNIYTFVAVMIGYMGGTALLNNLYNITTKKAIIMAVLGMVTAYGLSFLSFAPIVAPFAGLFVVTGFTVLMRKLPHKMLLWLSKEK